MGRGSERGTIFGWWSCLPPLYVAHGGGGGGTTHAAGALKVRHGFCVIMQAESTQAKTVVRVGGVLSLGSRIWG